MTTGKQLKAMRELGLALVDACKQAGPLGAPGGHLYAATMSVLTLDQFTSVMGTLEKLGYIRKDGECYVHVRDVA